ncbi:hypothetical protein DICPUDRAFT_74698 [Dictyostelium purpureum]|uniref:Uncharacterized protein n=1 Tax=Dictyostelium purpureum TaxID=5786 RepID=F0Z8H5_DICPU|nr:uncharacterized protein DICPUDRAFT_74698 [Dictyostelium purpureum]EGC39729.1 hypothetical protein DICPUDRAFT_74698 [Dictyostelium purpureum]|eukprot:XP_003283715.1 hypothetical protein DICPUDRAFT_74698 [Dictyostelium purpureum]
MSNYNNTHRLPSESYGDVKTSKLIVPTSLPPYLVNLISFEEYLETIHQIKALIENTPSSFLTKNIISASIILLCFFIPVVISLCVFGSTIGIYVGGAVSITVSSLFIIQSIRRGKKMKADLDSYLDEINARYYSKRFSFFCKLQVYGRGRSAFIEKHIFVRIYHPDLPLPTPPPQYLSYQNTQPSPQNLPSDNFEPHVDEKTLLKNF